MKRFGNAISQGITGGVVAFATVFVIALVLAAAVGHLGNAENHTQFAVGAPSLGIATILGGSFGVLYFAMMFFGELVPKRVCSK